MWINSFRMAEGDPESEGRQRRSPLPAERIPVVRGALVCPDKQQPESRQFASWLPVVWRICGRY
jgi:hypothetical protein